MWYHCHHQFNSISPRRHIAKSNAAILWFYVNMYNLCIDLISFLYKLAFLFIHCMLYLPHKRFCYGVTWTIYIFNTTDWHTQGVYSVIGYINYLKLSQLSVLYRGKKNITHIPLHLALYSFLLKQLTIKNFGFCCVFNCWNEVDRWTFKRNRYSLKLGYRY